MSKNEEYSIRTQFSSKTFDILSLNSKKKNENKLKKIGVVWNIHNQTHCFTTFAPIYKTNKYFIFVKLIFSIKKCYYKTSKIKG